MYGRATVMGLTYEIIRGSVLLVVFLLLVGWVLYCWLRKSRDRGGLIFRWVLSVPLLIVCGVAGRLAAFTDQAGAIVGLILAAVCGLFMAILWTPVIVDWVGRKFGSLIDGGDDEIEPKPLYSIFHAQRSQGKYYVALAEIRRQLDKFPTDFEGLMLLAELQAENLNDLPGAEVTIHRLCGSGNHTPNHIAYALNQLADWHLSLTKDRDGAQKALEKITELLPETEMSLHAAQRIARLADTESLLAPQSRRRVAMKKGVAFLGLQQARDRSKPPEVDLEQAAADYVKHLEQHPLDSLAREKLAVLYATHFHRLDMALDQLDQLVRQPNHPPKQVVHWLNLMADLQVREGDEFERIRETLERIIDQYPDLAATENTRRRLNLLKLELKGKEPAQAVQLGIYEKDIGLKRSAPDRL